jgi:hypothetical protein
MRDTVVQCPEMRDTVVQCPEMRDTRDCTRFGGSKNEDSSLSLVE